MLLQIRSLVDHADYEKIINEVASARQSANPLDTVAALQRGEFADQLVNAARIRPIIHEKTRGNPRRIKRFLNDLSVRLSIASKRGIELDEATIAKLMILEQYFPDDFKIVTDWLRERTLRSNLEALEKSAGTPEPTDSATTEVEARKATIDEGASTVFDLPTAKVDESMKPGAHSNQRFSDGLIRWARLSPTLSKKDIAPYLVFAASFKHLFLESGSLPETIRDMATQLLSRSPAEARGVTDEMLRSLQPSEASQLASYIGGVAVDEPQRQTSGVVAMIRISRAQPSAVEAVVNSLKRIRPSELKVGAFATLDVADPKEVLEQLEAMATASGKIELTNALALVKEGL